MQPERFMHLRFEHTPLRALIANGRIVFSLTDLCRILGYRNGRDAVTRHCRADGVSKHSAYTPKGRRTLTFIDEGNAYRLILKSVSPEAPALEMWLADTALPTMRLASQGGNGAFKHGGIFLDRYETHHLHVMMRCFACMLDNTYSPPSDAPEQATALLGRLCSQLDHGSPSFHMLQRRGAEILHEYTAQLSR